MTLASQAERISSTTEPDRAALVLSGGGARGAYAVGVLAGLHDALGPDASGLPIFDTFTGTSVGAINAAYLAAHADRPDLGIPGLVRVWTGLTLASHLRPNIWHLAFGSRRRWRGSAHRGSRLGRALLDARPFEHMVERGIPWERLHRNIEQGIVRALLISALRICDGRTTTFAELAPGSKLIASGDPRRDARIETITSDHVLASAALPLLFPARRVGDVFFCDGGLRFNTPISPAIRCGAKKLVIIALRAGGPPRPRDERMLEQFPNPVFLLGKLLDALLLDPVDYDLQVLERFNRVLDLVAESVPLAARQQIARAVEDARGLPYRHLRTLVFRPSKDIGVLAAEHLRNGSHKLGGGWAASVILERAAAIGQNVEADLLSYLLLDGDFARKLIELGRHDAQGRGAEIRAFFNPRALSL